MKARVKATGNIVDVEWYSHNSMGTIYADVTHTAKYYEYELDFNTVYDYWTRLEHQYAGMAMQGFCANYNDFTKVNDGTCTNVEMICENARIIAHALVKKLKNSNIEKEK